MAYRSLAEITEEQISAVGIPSDHAEVLHRELRCILRDHGSSAPDAWKSISRRLLNLNQPFAFHQMMYYGCYKDYRPDTPPAWFPDKESAALTNIGQLLERQGKGLLGSKYVDPVTNFLDLQEFAVSNPEAYWKMVFEEMRISFSIFPSCILREHGSFPGGQWLPGVYINSAGSCLSLNDKKGLDDIMIIWRDEGYDSLPVHRMTLKELNEEVRLAMYIKLTSI